MSVKFPAAITHRVPVACRYIPAQTLIARPWDSQMLPMSHVGLWERKRHDTLVHLASSSRSIKDERVVSSPTRLSLTNDLVDVP